MDHTLVTLQHLACWAIRDQTRMNEQPVEFLRHCTAPSLRRLHFANFDRHPPLPTVSNFIRRSRCDLTELVIYNCYLRATDTLEVLSLVPNLNTLAVEYALPDALTDKVTVHALTLNPDQPSHLPSLTMLHIDGSYLFQEHSLIAMLESRTSVILPVLSARLD
ncbi:hypothetical protein FB451DRAFT_1412386 [Mycena latifolia]|nr:hypothetical protein FB451DRAFT_1412386 [Mycena latifolia]